MTGTSCPPTARPRWVAGASIRARSWWSSAWWSRAAMHSSRLGIRARYKNQAAPCVGLSTDADGPWLASSMSPMSMPASPRMRCTAAILSQSSSLSPFDEAIPAVAAALDHLDAPGTRQASASRTRSPRPPGRPYAQLRGHAQHRGELPRCSFPCQRGTFVYLHAGRASQLMITVNHPG
jgi:hypothetical protein